MATLNSFIPLMTFLLYFSSLLLVLFSCFLERSEALESHFHPFQIDSHLPAPDCNRSTDRSLLNLESLRKSLVRQEDTIVFSLIERSKYPMNSQLYNNNKGLPKSYASLFDFFIKESEAVQAKAGRYTFEEENAFFPNILPPSLVPPLNCTPVLYPRGASININDQILYLYLNTLLPQIAANGDDGNYAPTAASDLSCLQALSTRIHYGKFVAEVKYSNAPGNYTRAIRTKNRKVLMKLLTSKSVEDKIIKRVEKKAMIFGQDVENVTSRQYKVNASIVSQFYGESVIPLTKNVQVEYLLHRLD